MRVKTEARRQAILDIAADVFSEAGYEGATMSEIALRVGNSKATLYNYFPSKEELFFEAAMSSAEKQGVTCFHKALQTQGSLRDVLQALGESLVDILAAPSIIAMLRTVIAESGRSELGRLFYQRGTREAWLPVKEFLQGAIDRKELRDVDPYRMTMHLRGLYEAEIYDQLLLGVVSKIPNNRRAEMVAAAVEVFLLAYGYGRGAQQVEAG